MVYIFRNTNVDAVAAGETGAIANSMLYVMGEALSNIFQKAYVIIAPFIGVLGAFMSGSNTVSNTLFSGLQHQAAISAGLPAVIIVALQNNGGAIGNMVCVNNVVAATATTGTIGNEGKIIRTNALPMFLLSVLVIVVASIMIFVLGINPDADLGYTG